MASIEDTIRSFNATGKSNPYIHIVLEKEKVASIRYHMFSIFPLIFFSVKLSQIK